MILNHLWHRLWVGVLLAGLGVGSLNAQSITVETLNRHSQILINGQVVATEMLYLFPVLEGRHLVTVRDDGRTLFSAAYALKRDQDLIIHLTATGNVRYEAITRQAPVAFPKRAVLNVSGVIASQGPLALGIHYSESLQGLSYRHWFGQKLGFEAVGWVTSPPPRYKDTIGARALYSLLELAVNNRLARYYVGLGFGNKYIATASSRKRENMTEVFWGTELPSGHWGIMTYSIELAYEWVAVENGSDRENLRINVGSHFYVAGK